jgi:predicted dehydrogenase
MNKIYNWGIIGPGRIAHKFAEGLKTIPNARLLAVASRAQKRADIFAKEYQVDRSYEGYRHLAYDQDVDIIYVATPHTEHFKNTIMCLEQGKAVLCEKPMAMNTKEVKIMAATAKKHNTFVMEALWTRFLPSTIKLQDLLQKKVVGDIQMIKADFGFVGNKDPEWRLFNKELGGGALLDVGIYPVFITRLLLGNPSELKAFANIGSTGVDDSCSVIMKFPGGQLAEVYASIVTDTEIVATVYGTKGKIVVNRRFFTPTSIDIYYHDGEHEHVAIPSEGNGYNYEAQEVMHCLDEKLTESPLMPLDLTLDIMNMMDNIRKECGLVYPEHDNEILK